MNNLEIILKYKMDEAEVKAYKICLIWQKLCSEVFPNERFPRFNSDKDPRKTTLFKYGYKLIRETKGLLSDDREYYFYVLAQLQTLKHLEENNIHPLIEPQILVGEKAWKRWKRWNWIYKQRLKEVNTFEEMEITASFTKIKNELNSTYNFLEKHNCLKLSETSVEKIHGWMYDGKISNYYAILSPCMQNIMQDNPVVFGSFDFNLYRPSITPEVESFFKEKFKHEYK